MKLALLAWFFAFLFIVGFAQPALALSDAEVKQAIIAESLSSYPGNCPCPYNRDRAGRKCGKRSAYTKPGGYSPICYPDDVSPAMIKEWRSRNLDVDLHEQKE